MGLRIERIPTLRDNYTYLLICEATGEAAVIDAPEADPVLRRIDATGARVAQVLSTHHHPDHCAANPVLAQRFGAPVVGHVSDADRLPGFTRGVEEGDVVRVGREEARVLHVPAHTRGHVAYVFDSARAAFTGDTLFAGGCGRLFEGTAEMMFAALHDKLGQLGDDVRIFCGHEYTESNLRFAAHVDPSNRAVTEKLERVRLIRAHPAASWHDAKSDEMTIPSTMGEERGTNPFVRARDGAELGRLRARKDAF